MTEFLNENIVRSILASVDKIDGDGVSVPKPVIRSMGFELLRLWGLEDPAMKEKTYFIQMLTLEYAVAHVIDLFKNLREENLDKLSSREIINYAIENLQNMAKEVTLPYGGQS